MCAESKRERDILRTDSEQASHDLQTLITSNLTEYRILRNNKTKLTQQLQYWIAKYDDDVGVRTEEIGQLRAKLKELTDDFEKWQAETYDPQLEQLVSVNSNILVTIEIPLHINSFHPDIILSCRRRTMRRNVVRKRLNSGLQ